MLYKYLAKPLLFRMDAEQAHNFTARMALRCTYNDKLSSFVRGVYNYQHRSLAQSFWGLTFRNPVGLAAGFDKNGRLVKAVENAGLGFTEVGSITAHRSMGNERPRAFRLPKDDALINRMGLNNKGARTVVRSMERSTIIPVGINIAKTHDSTITGDDAIRDYLRSYNEAEKTADYITINISCPNTAEGKTFEHTEPLSDLLSALPRPEERTTPTLVKFSPDLSTDNLKALIDVCEYYQIDGYAACNTSSVREGLQTSTERLHTIGQGGLSGKPVFNKSINTIKQIRQTVRYEKPIIGIGGIHSLQTALQMLHAGANLLQIFTGFIYEGPGLVKKINKGLAKHMRTHNLSSLNELNN